MSKKKKPVWRDCSGLVVFRKKRGEVQVLVVKSSTSGRWVFPKGGIERSLTPEANAIKEVYEEGGVVVSVLHEIPTLTVPYYKDTAQGMVTYFLSSAVLSLEDYPEVRLRKRKWVSLNKGAKLLDDDQQSILGFFRKSIKESV